MLVYHQFKLPYFHSKEEFENKLYKVLHVNPEEVITYTILKHSIDARMKPTVFSIYSVLISLKKEDEIYKKNRNKNLDFYHKQEYQLLSCGSTKIKDRPIVVGAGPCGLFATLLLAREGFCPILLERGKSIEERTLDVLQFWKTGILNENSNVQFGEGGAGTFSDGKLNTQIKDKNNRISFILEKFVAYGADPSILYENKPHVGTDVLQKVVVHMREEIISLGGEIRFESKVTDFRITNDRITSLLINDAEEIPTSICILAIGHSARDTFRILHKNNFQLEKKNFSIGLRVEHPRQMIDSLQYGEENFNKIPSASYKLTFQSKNGKGVYSFCMCPGGVIVNASSENNKLAINGMSYFSRNGRNSNSAIVVQVDEHDIPDAHPLAGMFYQEKLESLAFKEGNGKVMIQRFIDFCDNKPSKINDFTYLPTIKGEYTSANIRNVLPENISTFFIEGMHYFGKKISGFDNDNTILSGVETRTSSPIRITRNEFYQSNISGIFPAGEGAGYAGGIISAAIDGMKIVEEICKIYKPKDKRM